MVVRSVSRVLHVSIKVDRYRKLGANALSDVSLALSVYSERPRSL